MCTAGVVAVILPISLAKRWVETDPLRCAFLHAVVI